MTMKTTLVFALCIVSTAAITPAHAETYQWKDSTGRTIISDTPPPGSAREQRTMSGRPVQAPKQAALEAEGGTGKPAEKNADGPKTTAERDLDFKKRQQEAREKAEKEAKEQAVAAQKRDNCERARRNVAALESAQPMATLNEKGERITMDSNQRNEEMERSRRVIADACN